MRKFCVYPLITLSLGLLSGCDRPPTGPKSVKVTGQIFLDGKSLHEGEVLLGLPGQAPSVLTVTDGAFAGEAKVGKNRIEIRAFKDGPPASTDPNGAPTKVNYLPAKYNEQSTLTAEVVEGAANEFKFDVTSR